MSGRLRMALVVAAASLAACQTNSINNAGDTLVQYAAAKRNLADQLGMAIGAGKTDSYRLVALLGPAYPIGTALDAVNLSDPLTDACVLPDGEVPKVVPWTDIPTVTHSKKIDVKIGLPEAVVKAMKNMNEAKLSIDWQRGGTFGLNELSQRVMAKDVFEARMRADKCQTALRGKPALVVRGIVYGKETFSNTNTFKPGVTVKAWQSEILNISYNDVGEAKLEDKDAKQKFYVVSMMNPGERAGGGITFANPGDIAIQALEARSSAK